MAQSPLPLRNIQPEPFRSRVLFHTTYSEYFKQNAKVPEILGFIAELAQHLPPQKGAACSPIRRVPFTNQRMLVGNDVCRQTGTKRVESVA